MNKKRQIMFIKLHARIQVQPEEPQDSYDKVLESLNIEQEEDSEPEYVPILVNPDNFLLITEYEDKSVIDFSYSTDTHGENYIKSISVRETLEEIQDKV